MHFQSAGTRVHELNSKSKEFFKELAYRFIKPQLFKHLDFVREIYFPLSQYQIVLDDIDLGRDCNLLLRQIPQETLEEIENMKNLRNTCLNFYTNSEMDILKRFPIDDEFLRKLEVFSAPKVLFDSDRQSNFKDVLFISKELGGFDEEDLQKKWSILPEDLTLLRFLATQNFDGMWKTLLSAKDNEGSLKYRNLRDLLTTIRTLPHSNADAGRAFSTIIDIIN